MPLWCPAAEHEKIAQEIVADAKAAKAAELEKKTQMMEAWIEWLKTADLSRVEEPVLSDDPRMSERKQLQNIRSLNSLLIDMEAEKTKNAEMEKKHGGFRNWYGKLNDGTPATGMMIDTCLSHCRRFAKYKDLYDATH